MPCVETFAANEADAERQALFQAVRADDKLEPHDWMALSITQVLTTQSYARAR